MTGFLFAEKEKQRNIKREMTDAFQVPVAFMHRLKKGEDFVTPDGEIIANGRLTTAPPAPRSYAYMTDTLFREAFAYYVIGVVFLYHDSTFGNEFAVFAIVTFHSTAGLAARMAVLAGVKHLLLGHISSR